MTDGELEARIETTAEGRVLVRAPAVGWWIDPPERGQLVGPGCAIGRLVQLTRSWNLRLPGGTCGRVVRVEESRRVVAVEYGERLVELEPPGAFAEAGSGAGAPSEAERAGLGAGEIAVRAPSDGIFYQRPAPGAAPFVTPGQRVRAGQAVGLVEVMKTFNQIAYGGPGHPAEAEVVEVRGGDAREVVVGEILVVLRGVAGSAGAG